jgi:hypothetical protein
MKRIITSFAIVLLCSIAEAKDIQLFNPDLFGQPTTKEIKPLNDRKTDEIEPIIIKLDIKDGKYIASTITYPAQITFEEARESINRYYKKYEHNVYKTPAMAVWRVTDKKFMISLTREEDTIQLIYIQFQPNEMVFKSILKSMGADVDCIKDNVCK